MDTETLLKQLAQSLCMPALRLNALGACGLLLDGDTYVGLQFLEQESLLRLTATLGSAAAADRQQLVALLLLTNLVHSEWGRPCLALEAGTDRLVLVHVLDLADMDGAKAKQAVDFMATACREVRSRLAEQQLVLA